MDYQDRLFVSSPTFISLVFAFFGEWTTLLELKQVCRLFYRTATDCPASWKSCEIQLSRILFYRRHYSLRPADDCVSFIQRTGVQFIPHWIYDANNWCHSISEYDAYRQVIQLAHTILSSVSRITRLSGSVKIIRDLLSLSYTDQLTEWRQHLIQSLPSGLTSLDLDGNWLELPTDREIHQPVDNLDDLDDLDILVDKMQHLQHFCVHVTSWCNVNGALYPLIQRVTSIRIERPYTWQNQNEDLSNLTVYVQLGRLSNLETLDLSCDGYLSGEKLEALMKCRTKSYPILHLTCHLCLDDSFFQAVKQYSNLLIVQQTDHQVLHLHASCLEWMTRLVATCRSSVRRLLFKLDKHNTPVETVRELWSLAAQCDNLVQLETQFIQLPYRMESYFLRPVTTVGYHDVHNFFSNLSEQPTGPERQVDFRLKDALVESSAVLHMFQRASQRSLCEKCTIVFPTVSHKNSANSNPEPTLVINTLDLFHHHIVQSKKGRTNLSKLHIIVDDSWLALSHQDQDMYDESVNESIPPCQPIATKLTESVENMLQYIVQLGVCLTELTIHLSDGVFRLAHSMDRLEPLLGSLNRLNLRNMNLSVEEIQWIHTHINQCQIINCTISPAHLIDKQ